MEIGVFSNVNIFKLIRQLRKDYTVYESQGCGIWVPELIRQGERPYHMAIFLLDGKELFRNSKDQEALVKEYMGYIEYAAAQHPDIQYLISDLDIRNTSVVPDTGEMNTYVLEAEWKEGLEALCKMKDNVYCFSIKRMIEELGRACAYSPKMWYLALSPYSEAAEKRMKQAIIRAVRALEGKRKKCLLLDLDNTLWGGIAGEEGIYGIELSGKEGARYQDFQRNVLRLKKLGVLLGIVSKNNEHDAELIFQNHPDMILKWDDFVVKKINWLDKAQNIIKIQRELNIGFDSMVFIDDNPRERELVRRQLSEVIVPEFPRDSCMLEEFIKEVYEEYFLSFKLTKEDLDKSELYRQQAERNKLADNYEIMEDYLRSLDTRIRIKRLAECEIERAFQLVQKTNQFNLTALRYEKAELKRKMCLPEYDIWIGETEDKFGSSGKSILIVIKKEDRQAVIENFIMSCRIMGRAIEESVLTEAEEFYKRKGFDRMIGKYLKTDKNVPVENFYLNMGYTWQQSNQKEQQYKRKLGNPVKGRRLLARMNWEDSK